MPDQIVIQPAGNLSVPKDIVERAAKIKLILTDVDGVMTDGLIYYVEATPGNVVEFKGFSSHDGLGLHFCHMQGITTGIISGRSSQGVIERAKILNMKYVYQGLLDKVGAYNEILADGGFNADQVAFVGDDFTDCPLMMRSGLGVAPSNARPEVCQAAHYVAQARGGEGVLREIIEIILKSQGLWQGVLKKYGLA